MSYQHGAYGEIGNDKVKSAVQVDTVVASHYASRSTAILRTQSETWGRSISSTY